MFAAAVGEGEAGRAGRCAADRQVPLPHRRERRPGTLRLSLGQERGEAGQQGGGAQEGFQRSSPVDCGHDGQLPGPRLGSARTPCIDAASSSPLPPCPST